MIKKLVMVSLLLTLSGLANAAEPKSSGVYFGAGYGMSTLDDDGLALASSLSFDDGDKVAMLFGGYKFIKYFSLEARYADLGTFSLEGFDLDVSAFSAHAVGIIPLGGSGFELFGNLGYGNLDFAAGELELDESQSVVIGGLGLRWNFTENFSLAGQVDAYVWAEEDLSETYDLSVNATSLAIQFTF